MYALHNAATEPDKATGKRHGYNLTVKAASRMTTQKTNEHNEVWL